MTTVAIPTKEIVLGIENLLYDYIGLRTEDFIIVCFWHKCIDAAAWIIYQLEERCQQHSYYSFSHRDPNKFSSDVEGLMANASAQVSGDIIVLVCEEEELGFSSFLKSLQKRERVKVWRTMNTSAHLFEQAFAVKKNNLKNINANLISRMIDNPQQKLCIENSYGTKLNVKINNEKYKWISTYGSQRKNELIILPTGEINTFPDSISGTFVAFGAIHSNIDLPFDARLQDKHVTLQIENGVLKGFHCQDNNLYSFLKLVFNEENLTTVGEFGIGTNIGITKFVANNSHINERFPGVHLGLGMHLQKNNSVSYQSPIHMDFISPYGHIYFDDKTSIDLSQLTQLSSVEMDHPHNISAEDGE